MRSGLRLVAGCAMLASALALAGVPAGAVTSGGKSEQAPPGDGWAEGQAAFERGDWAAVVDHMARVVEERPWHDDAYNLMGFAHRKLGDYPAALEAYERALRLNPHHLGALEYLGEAYLELDRPELAQATLDRLAAACRRIEVATTGGGQPSCEEWRELNAAVAAHLSARGGD